MKLKRTKKYYGAAGGYGTFDSDMFSVYVMTSCVHGKYTKLECRLIEGYELTYDGDQSEHLHSDKDCLEQCSMYAIMRMIKAASNESFKAGEKSKQDEIRAALGVKS
jgi:hypothetical protein